MTTEPRVPTALPRLTPRPDAVADVTTPRRSLAGDWWFTAAPPDEPPGADADWRTHDVPGQWATEGYAVDESAGDVGWYSREFRVPTDWAGRVKLRFGAVYSHATVWVDGGCTGEHERVGESTGEHERVGEHEGGYTPFEVDVTDAVSPGANRLAVAVRESSRAAELDWGNVTGGVLRDVTLFTVPDCALSQFHVETELGDDADTVRALLTATNDGDAAVDAAEAELRLTGPDGETVATRTATLGAIPDGASRDLAVDLTVDDSERWNPESPALYDVECTLAADGEGMTATRRTGIRDIAVAGNELRVNGTAVTLRGVNWEEVDPEREGVLSAAQTRRDAERLRAANVNYVRPHTYPPTEAFLDACDELGILVQVEFPFTFVREETADLADDDAYRETFRRGALETVSRDRSRPSVAVWSLANESVWGRNFAAVADAVAEADPTRPKTFNWAEYDDADADHCEVGNHHYPEMRVPGADTATDFAGFDRPVLFDEYAHVYCYNHRELATDPGLRDDWGRFLDTIWETVRGVDAAAGAAVFSGIDHVHPEFRWGTLDSHRRERPEYWHTKKVYAPVRAREVDRTDDAVAVELRNRREFESLGSCRIAWRVGDEESESDSASGTISADVPPGERDTVLIPLPSAAGRDAAVTLRVFDETGLLLDAYRFEETDGESGSIPEEPATGSVSEDGPALVLAADEPAGRWAVDRGTGRLLAATDRGPTLDGVPTPVVTPLESGRTGEHRDAEPFEGCVDDWTVTDVTAVGDAVRLDGSGDGVDAAVTFEPLANGWVRLAYDLTVTAEATAREVGLALDLTPGHETLSWTRDAYWSVYPDGHVGRTEGVARAFPVGERRSSSPSPADAGGSSGGDRDFSRPWSRDGTARGSNDFRAARRNVRTAGLTTDDGRGIELRAGGDAHVRAAVLPDGVRLFALARSLAGSGGEWFDRNATVDEDPDLSTGATVTGTFDVRLTGE
ncbi:MAG: glycoside hydrolase family 2 TIM barrel-domain containing protein [Halosimplex sp.]